MSSLSREPASKSGLLITRELQEHRGCEELSETLPVSQELVTNGSEALVVNNSSFRAIFSSTLLCTYLQKIENAVQVVFIQQLFATLTM